jgi:anti-anti-sigma factor
MKETSFSTREEPGLRVLIFQGRLDSAGSEFIRPGLDAELAQRGAEDCLRFDLSGVDFVASAFLRHCIRSAKEVGNERFELTGLAPNVREVFEITGLTQYMKIL